jgi:hypothetical protein
MKYFNISTSGNGDDWQHCTESQRHVNNIYMYIYVYIELHVNVTDYVQLQIDVKNAPSDSNA